MYYLKKRYSYKFKFVTSQPDRTGGYYIYKFEKTKEKYYITAFYYIPEREVIIFKEKIEYEKKEKGYEIFKKFQEKIEERKFY